MNSASRSIRRHTKKKQSFLSRIFQALWATQQRSHVTVTGKGRENFSDCHLEALAQAPFELLRLSAQEEAYHDLRSVQLAAQDERIPDLAAFLGSGSQTVSFPRGLIKAFAIQDGGSSTLPSAAALARYAGLIGRLANERLCGMILLASGFAWGLAATDAEDMVASFDYEQAVAIE